MKKIPGNLLLKPGKAMEISWNFVSLKKWEPWLCIAWEKQFYQHAMYRCVSHNHRTVCVLLYVYASCGGLLNLFFIG